MPEKEQLMAEKRKQSVPCRKTKEKQLLLPLKLTSKSVSLSAEEEELAKGILKTDSEC